MSVSGPWRGHVKNRVSILWQAEFRWSRGADGRASAQGTAATIQRRCLPVLLLLLLLSFRAAAALWAQTPSPARAKMGARLSKDSSAESAEGRLLRALNEDVGQLVQPPSGAQRGALVLGYGALLAVNVASGMGAFGPSNAVVSNAYPTAITPSGYAFAIWGVIFMLEGAGVVYGSLPCSGPGSVRAVSMHAVRAPWLAMWTCQVRRAWADGLPKGVRVDARVPRLRTSADRLTPRARRRICGSWSSCTLLSRPTPRTSAWGASLCRARFF